MSLRPAVLLTGILLVAPIAAQAPPRPIVPVQPSLIPFDCLANNAAEDIVGALADNYVARIPSDEQDPALRKTTLDLVTSCAREHRVVDVQHVNQTYVTNVTYAIAQELQIRLIDRGINVAAIDELVEAKFVDPELTIGTLLGEAVDADPERFVSPEYRDETYAVLSRPSTRKLVANYVAIRLDFHDAIKTAIAP